MRRISLASLLLAFLVALLAPARAHAWERLPVKVDCAFNFRVNVRCGPSNQSKAPWYSYFPYDPNLQSKQGGNPYPTWPTPFPPAEASNDKSASRFPNWPSHVPSPASGTEPDTRSGPAAHIATLANPSLAAASYWQTSFSIPSGSMTLPPSVNGAQVPSYWYGR